MSEVYELVPLEELKPGDQIYLMAQRRTVMELPWHPKSFREGLLRLPMSDESPDITRLSPPFEHDFLVPRLRREPERAPRLEWKKKTGTHYVGLADGAELFNIYWHTQRDDPNWLMRSRLPGLEMSVWRDDEREPLQEIAEERLAAWLDRIGGATS